MVLATIFGFLALRLTDPTLVVIMLFAAQFFLWFYNGPINALLANTVPSALRARAFAFSIFVIHILGDAISPSVVGFASDRIGLPHAIQLVPLAMGVGALIWLFAWRRLPELARESPAPSESATLPAK